MPSRRRLSRSLRGATSSPALLDAYTLVDAAATYRRGKLRFTLSGHNLFNNEYYSEGDLELASPGAPRQILFTTSVSFR